MKKLTLMHTSDIHGYISPTDFNSYKDLGLSKCATLVEKLRAESDFSLLLDGGDLIQGSALTYYLNESKLVKNPIIECLNEMKYDGAALGNHEFNYGREYLDNAIETANFPYICANIIGLNTKPYKVYQFDELRVGVIGLTTKYIPNWENPEHIKDLQILDPVDVYGKYEKELIEKSDIIIVNYHGGMELDLENSTDPTEKLIGENQGSELINKFSSIDVLLTGHQHRVFAKNINGTFVSQSGNNSKNLSVTTIDVLNKTVVDMELIPITSDIQTSSLIDKIIEPSMIATDQFLDQIICKSDEDILIGDDIFKARKNGHPLVNLIQKIQLEYLGGEIAVGSLFDSAVGFSKDITIRQILLNYPYPNTLVLAQMKGEDILEAIKKSATYFTKNGDSIVINPEFLYPKVQSYNYDMYYGVNYKIIVGENENIVTTDLDLNRIYKVVVNSYRSSNFAVYPSYKNAKIIQTTDQDTIAILIDYFTKTDIINVDNKCNFTVE